MKFQSIDKQFFEGETVGLARRLLGCYLVHELGENILVGRIVEVEAYLGASDPAAHSYRGETERTRAMFGPAGQAYIYFSYGNHYCLNVTAGPKGVGEGVLLRAVEPVEGVELMRQHRHEGRSSTMKDTNLTNGPGKLVQALGITKLLYGHSLVSRPLFISPGQVDDDAVAVGPRIGISKAVDLALRFWVKDNPWVSMGSGVNGR